MTSLLFKPGISSMREGNDIFIFFKRHYHWDTVEGHQGQEQEATEAMPSFAMYMLGLFVNGDSIHAPFNITFKMTPLMVAMWHVKGKGQLTHLGLLFITTTVS